VNENLWKVPLILNKNRIKRAYVGGKLLDQWQGIEPATDGQFPEEFIVSTIEVSNADRFPGEGLSKLTLENGREVTLRDLIKEDPTAYLGEPYANLMDGLLGVLARVGDTIVRHVIQVHPNKEIANMYLKFPNGKDEAWYIIATREIDGQTPYAYAGFRKGINRDNWQELFVKQDIQGMLAALNKLENLKEGDILMIPAGLPHAIGPGALFLEVHEPCDYTFRLEREYLTGRTFSDEEIHYGIGLNAFFDAFNYATYSLEEIKSKIIKTPKLIRQTEFGSEYELIAYADTPNFAVNKIKTYGEYPVLPFEGHRLAIITKGFGTMIYHGGEKSVRQGQGVFLPAGLRDLKLFSDSDMEVVLAYPPKIN